MKKFLLILALIAICSIANAKFEIQTSTGYTSSSDGKTKNTFSDMTNHIFLGASFDNKEKIIVGQSASFVSNQFKATNTDKLSTTELGPRLNYYFNDDKTFFAAITWNPYAKGKRTAAGVSEDISGWSYLLSIGAVSKLGNNFFLGASLNYHSLSISKAIAGTTAATVNNTYTSLMPMLNISMRFK
jgi:hypothetical protein